MGHSLRLGPECNLNTQDLDHWHSRVFPTRDSAGEFVCSGRVRGAGHAASDLEIEVLGRVLNSILM